MCYYLTFNVIITSQINQLEINTKTKLVIFLSLPTFLLFYGAHYSFIYIYTQPAKSFTPLQSLLKCIEIFKNDETGISMQMGFLITKVWVIEDHFEIFKEKIS